MGKGSKRQYTLEFKQQAAELAKEIGISQAALKLGVSVSAIRQWKIKHEGLGVSELRRLKQLEEENVRLKQLVADLSLDKQILQDVVKKKF